MLVPNSTPKLTINNTDSSIIKTNTVLGKLVSPSSEEDPTRKYIYYPLAGEYSKSKAYINAKCGM